MANLLFGEVLESYLSISKEEIEKALQFQDQYGGKLGEILLHSGILSEEQISSALAVQFGIKDIKTEVKDPSKIDLAPLEDIEPEWFVVNEIIPLFIKDSTMYFLIKDPLNYYPIETVSHIYSEYKINFFLSDERKYREILNFFKIKYLEKRQAVFDEGEIE